ncbi:TPA: BlaI/MecI/CopY family transcriptional regulator, partial [Elizabethkingia meningoseptica]
MKSLTPAEETLMHALWTIEKGFLKDIMEAYPDPKPHHNTVATVLKILVEKGFLKVKPFGRLHRYEIRVSKEQYYQQLLRLFIEEYYQASPELLLAEMFRLELLNKDSLTPYIATTAVTTPEPETVSVKKEKEQPKKVKAEK